MRPLQEHQQSARGTAMRLRDPISSYKCFEAIATPSPIPINCTDIIGNGDNRGASNLHRSTSLDSLANSSEQGSSSDDIGQLSDVDSINEYETNKLRGRTQVQVHRKSDLEEAKLNEVSTVNQEPVIKAYLEKSHRKCDYKNCGFKEKNGADSVDGDIIFENVNGGGSVSSIASVGGLSQKSRRHSVASSGSIGRMETIIEEPIEPKISVKEILARFETLNSLEVVEIVLLYSRNRLGSGLNLFSRILRNYPFFLIVGCSRGALEVL